MTTTRTPTTRSQSRCERSTQDDRQREADRPARHVDPGAHGRGRREAFAAYAAGLRDETSQDIALSLFWRAHGLSSNHGIPRIVEILAPGLPEGERGEVVDRLTALRADVLAKTAEALRTDPGSFIDRSVPSMLWSRDAVFCALLREALHALEGAPARAR